MPIKPRRRRKAKTIHIHDQHGQSAFNPKARTRSKEAVGGTVLEVVVYTIGGGSGETYIVIDTSIKINICTYGVNIPSGNDRWCFAIRQENSFSNNWSIDNLKKRKTMKIGSRRMEKNT